MNPIILVDDEEDLCISLARQLKREFPQTNIRSTSAPLEARRWIIEAPPMMLLTDLRMPEISGLELLTLVNNLWGRVPTIVMTAFPSTDFDKALELGTFYYLAKPFRNQELLRLVHQLMQEINGTLTSSPKPATPTMLAEIIQIYALTLSSGILLIDTPTQQGEIHYSKGHVQHAKVGELKGRDAFNTIAAWQRGHFNFLEQDLERPERTIDSPLTDLLQGALVINAIKVDVTQYHQKPDEETLDRLLLETGSHEWELSTLLSSRAALIDSALEVSARLPLSGCFQTVSQPTASPLNRNRSLLQTSGMFDASADNFIASLQQLKKLSGFLGACIGELPSTPNPRGKILGYLNQLEINWDAMLQEQHNAMTQQHTLLQLIAPGATPEDTVLRTEHHVQIYRPSRQHENIFFFLLLERHKANPTLARMTLNEVDQQLVITTTPTSFTDA